MKIKSDFVTNSSSSSFIVNYKNTKITAKKMTDIIFEDWKYFSEPVSEEFKNKIHKTIEKLKDDENILIPFSTNYETFIFRNDDGRIYVDTCQNHDWENELDIIEHFNPDDYDEEKESIKDNMSFINIKTEIIGTKSELLEIINKEFESGMKNEN